MTSKTNSTKDSAHIAVARGLNLPVSTKHCIEICDVLRYRDVSYAKRYLEEVTSLKRAVPFRKYTMNTGHKKGMSTGRFPQKAAREVLRLLNSVESNAQFKGLDTSNLKITKLLANKASIPMTGKRHRGATKRTHLEVEVMERKMPKAASVDSKKEAKESSSKVSAAHAEVQEAKPVKKELAPGPAEHKAEPKVEHKPAVKEPSSAELLKRAQQKAAELKQREKAQKETEDVSQLYEQLQKKGSLRK